MAMIMRAEIALAEAADRAVAAVEETFVDRDFRRPGFVLEAVNDAGTRAQGEQRPVIWLSNCGLVSEGNEIGEAGRAADEIDVAADGARGEIKGVVEDEAAARGYLAVAQIERLAEPD